MTDIWVSMNVIFVQWNLSNPTPLVHEVSRFEGLSGFRVLLLSCDFSRHVTRDFMFRILQIANRTSLFENRYSQIAFRFFCKSRFKSHFANRISQIAFSHFAFRKSHFTNCISHFTFRFSQKRCACCSALVPRMIGSGDQSGVVPLYMC